jgi:type IV pilus assembly protein PilC
MPRYRYRALDAAGNACAGEVDADAAEDAWNLVRGRGLVPVRLDPAPERSVAVRFGARRGASVRERAVFTRGLGTLVRAGLPLVRGLELLARQERNLRLRSAAEDVASAVRGGMPFSDALARHPRLFGRMHVDMVRAGEKAGVLGEILERLARFEEKRAALSGRVSSPSPAAWWRGCSRSSSRASSRYSPTSCAARRCRR